MRRDNAGAAVNARDDGLRKVTRLTWRAGAAGSGQVNSGAS
jgi:hypothetical protein